MAISFNVTPGYSFSASEKVTYSKLNLLGSPVIQLDGQASSAQIADGAVTTAKLASTIDINSKIADHNIDLDKLASGTHGQILYYDANGDLVTLDPSSAGKFLKCQGPGADPKWEAQAGLSAYPYELITTDGANKILATDGSENIEWRADTGLLPSIAAAGSVAYFNGSAWVALGLGTNGQTLQSNGTAPVWDASSSTSFSAKGKFATLGTNSVSYTGDTNIASATWLDAADIGTLTITFTSPVATDFPLFVRGENGIFPAAEIAVATNARSTAGVTLTCNTFGKTNPVINMMITT